MFVGTIDGRLIAIDAVTGKEIWSVVTVDQTKAYTITGAPRVVKGKVIIGNGGAEFSTSARATARRGIKSFVARAAATIYFYRRSSRYAQRRASTSGIIRPRPAKHGSRCHGAAAVGGGAIPDLRWSAFARDGEAWRSVVLGGVLKDRGMVSFASVLGDADAEALRAYVTLRSNESAPPPL